MRSIWKGYMRFSLVTIPIRIYSAVDSGETIRFNQLHKDDHGPVGYEKKCKKCGKALTNEEIVKGYQFEPEQYVIVTSDDLAKIKLQSTRIIEIEGFIDASEVPPALYEAPYYAGPDGAVAAKAYTLLSEALKAAGKAGIGKVVLRDREETVMISPMDGGLALFKLRQPEELRKMSEVPQIERREVNPDELKLSISLVETMSASLKEIDFADRYRDALREMIEAKIQGKDVVSAPEETKPMERARGERKEAAAARPAKASRRKEAAA
jgi:DNA end-binding protein Ku